MYLLAMRLTLRSNQLLHAVHFVHFVLGASRCGLARSRLAVPALKRALQISCAIIETQASSLFSTVARVLHDGSRGRVAKILALFAVACQTMGPSREENTMNCRALHHDTVYHRTVECLPFQAGMVEHVRGYSTVRIEAITVWTWLFWLWKVLLRRWQAGYRQLTV